MIEQVKHVCNTKAIAQCFKCFEAFFDSIKLN